MKVIALDYGSARTGVAVSDPTGTIARPLCVVLRAGGDGGLAELEQLVADDERADGGSGAEAVPDRLSRGLHPARHGRARLRRREDRGERAAQAGTTVAPRLSGRRRAEADPGLRNEEAAARGLPLPGDIRLPQGHDVGAARSQAAR